MTKSTPFHHGDLKRALFETALALLDREGCANVTLRAVAKATGVSHSAPDNHYASKGALLSAIAEHQFKRLLLDIDAALLVAPKAPMDRIAVIAAAIMDYGLTHPERYQLLWRTDLVDHDAPALKEAMDAVYARLCNEIEKNTADAHHDTHTVAVAIWSMIHGYVDMRQSGMFEALSDTKTGKPRQAAIIELFRAILGQAT